MDQVNKVLNQRSKVFDDSFLIYSKPSQEGLIKTENKPANTQSIEVSTVSLKSFLTDNADKPQTELPQNFKLEYIHQFLEDKEKLYGYASVKFDIFIERNSLQWTLAAFQQSKEAQSDDLSVIMQSFRQLNPHESVLSFQEFANLFCEPIKSKETCNMKTLNGNFWNLDLDKEMKDAEDWNCKGKAIDKIKLDAKKFEFEGVKSSLFPSSNKPRARVDEKFKMILVEKPFENVRMIRRIEAIMKLFIETVSNIDLQDINWKLILCFNSNNQLCGFMSLYEFGIDLNNQRVRISQVFVLPDSQKKGISHKMLSALY